MDMRGTLSKTRVLLVDDIPAILDVSKIFLEESGDLCIETVLSGQAALNRLKDATFDVIVSDYLMKDMNGIELLHHVRGDYGKIPFILFTCKERDEIVVDAIKNGVDSYVYKGGDPTAQFCELAQRIKFHAVHGKLVQKQESLECYE